MEMTFVNHQSNCRSIFPLVECESSDSLEMEQVEAFFSDYFLACFLMDDTSSLFMINWAETTAIMGNFSFVICKRIYKPCVLEMQYKSWWKAYFNKPFNLKDSSSQFAHDGGNFVMKSLCGIPLKGKTTQTLTKEFHHHVEKEACKKFPFMWEVFAENPRFIPLDLNLDKSLRTIIQPLGLLLTSLFSTFTCRLNL